MPKKDVNKTRQTKRIIDDEAERPKAQRKVKQVVDDSALTGAVALSGLSFAGHVVVDSFCRPNRPEFPDVPLMVISILLMGIAAPLAHYTSKWSILEYEVWQPFKGGDHFIILQMLGWMFYSTWIIAALISLNNRLAFQRGNGVLSTIGFMGFVATLLVVMSPSYFEASGSWAFPFGTVIRKRKETLLAVCLSGISFALSIGVDFMHDSSFMKQHGSELFLVSVAGSLLTNLIIHCLVGHRVHSPDYKLWQPFQGGLKFVLWQCIGWAGFSTATYLCINHNITLFPKGTPTLVGWLYILSSMSLLFSIEHFEKNSPVLMIWTGERVALFMVSVIGLALFILIEITWYYYEDIKTPPMSYFNLALLGGTVHFTLPFATQYMATRQQKGFVFFQPFIGGAKFVAMQALAWTVYTTSLIVWMLYMINQNSWKHVFAVGIFGFVCEVVILLSPNYFEPEKVPTDTTQSLNGELILSTLMSMGGAILFYIADVLDNSPFPRMQVIAVAACAHCIAPVTAHVCGRRAHQSYRAIQPFEGGAEFVALQSMAWTIYATMLVFYAVLLMNFEALEPSLQHPWLTVCGVVGVLPWVIVIGSIRYYQDASNQFQNDIDVTLNFRKHYGVASQDFFKQLSEIKQLVTDSDLSNILNSIETQFVDRQKERPPYATKSANDSHPITTLIATGLSVLALFLCLLADILEASIPGGTAIVSVIFMAGTVVLLVPPVMVHCKTGPSKYIHYRLWQPFRGGFHFVLLQTIGWCIYSLCCSGIVVVMFSSSGGVVTERPTIIGLHSLMGIFGTASYCVILMSLNHFQDDRDTVIHCGQNSFLQRNAEWTVSALMTTGAAGLFMAVESVRNKWGDVFSVAPIIFLAGLALFASIPLLYIAVRKSRNRASDESQEGASTGEIFGWVMSGVQAACAAMITYQTVIAVIPMNLLRPLLAVGTSVGVTVQVGFYLLIFWNEGRTLSKAISDAILEVAANVITSVMYLLPVVLYLIWMIVCFPATPGSMYFFIFMHVVTFSHLHAPLMALVRAGTVVGVMYGAYEFANGNHWGMLAWTSSAFLYTLTYNDDYKTGKRTSKAVENATWFWDLMGRYFGLTLTTDLDGETTSMKEQLMASGRPILFGFHPHGIYPFTCVYGTLHSMWKEKIGVRPSVHAASVLFGPPLLREMCMWIGGRDVSRQSLDQQLRNGDAAMLVPGGQAEMRMSHSSSKIMTLVSKHKGFVRLALRNGATLVPVFSFGEHLLMDNVRLPAIQTWFIRKLGFGYPHFPYGRLFLPIPRREHVSLVVGRPIPVEKIDNPTQAQVDDVHAQYYSSMTKLFESHKQKYGCSDITLEYI